ncbi:MAG: hypothetical protein AAF694_24755 [Bacteroidota bacterium]
MRLRGEYKKYNKKQLLSIIFGFCLIPFTLTLLFLWVKREAINGIPIDVIFDNISGAWSALLYSVLTITLIQIVTDVERKPNLLYYFRAYKRSWYNWIGVKVLLILGMLAGVTVLNILLTSLLIGIVSFALEGPVAFVALILGFSLHILKSFLMCIPIVCFHMLVTLSLKNSTLSTIFGLVILIVGIPIVNLSDFYFIPYNLTIAVQKPGIDLSTLGIYSMGIVVASVFLINRNLSKEWN